jgi:hypothetical protein
VPKAFSLPQQAQIVNLLKPATDAAGRTSIYFSLKNALKAYILVHIDQGNAATIALNLLQASAVAGTGSKALVGRIWSNLDTVASDLFTQQADASTYTTDAALKVKQVVFEVDASFLDLANSFTSIAIQTGASNVANLTEAIAIVLPARFSGATMPTALTD